MNSRILNTIFVLLGAISMLSGQDSDWTWDNQYHLISTSRLYLENTYDEYNAQQEFIGNVAAKLNYKHRWTLGFAGKAVVNLAHASRSRVFANEVYVNYKSKKSILKMGKQIIDWGHHTGISPLDILNRYDYYDVVDTDDELLGSWSMRYELFFNATNIEVMTIAPKQHSRIYIGNNRWGRTPKIIEDPNSAVEIPLHLKNIYTTSNNQKWSWGVRIAQELENFTLRADYYNGTNDIPQRGIDLGELSGIGLDYTLNLAYHPVQTLQFSGMTFIGDWNVWIDYAFIQNQRLLLGESDLIDDDYTVFSIGGDAVFSFDNPEKQLQLLFQYMKISDNSNTPYYATDIDHIFSNALITRGLYRFNYKLEAQLKMVYDIYRNGYLLHPQLGYRFSDRCQINLSSDIMGGNANGFFGASENSRVNFQLKYYFK